MRLSRAGLSLCAALMLASCGFRPLYAPALVENDVTAGSTLLDQVWIETIQGQSGVALRNYLLDGFYRHGYPEAARYLLTIVLSEFVRDVDVQKNDTTTRAQFVVLATYTMTDRTTNQIIDRGQVRSVAGYNILLSQYTTLVSQNDAKDRALRELSDKIQTRTTLVLSEPQTRIVQPLATSRADTPTGPAQSVFSSQSTQTQNLPANGTNAAATGDSAGTIPSGSPIQ